MSRSWPRMVLLVLGAVVFLFPFYYMLVGSLQSEPDTSLAGAFPTGGFTLDNYVDINGRVDLLRSLVNSGIFTVGVILCTVVLGVLAGYALARLHFRGGGTLFAAMQLVQVVPFQLLIIPLYVMIVRSYGLADSYLGMIVPFAINSTAVFIFRQFFLQLPEDLFSAARIDGAGEQAEHHRAQDDAAGEDAGVDQRAQQVDPVVDVDVVVQGEAAGRKGSRQRRVRFTLQRADEHVVEGEKEHQCTQNEHHDARPAG